MAIRDWRTIVGLDFPVYKGVIMYQVRRTGNRIWTRQYNSEQYESWRRRILSTSLK